MARPRKLKRIHEVSEVEIETAPVAEVPPAPSLPSKEEPSIVDQVIKLDDMTRMNLCRLDAEVRAARNQFMLQQMQLAEHIRSIDKDGKLAGMQAGLHATAMHMQEMEARYNGVRQEVEQKMGILLREYSFDDETGILHKIQPTAPKSEVSSTTPAA
jgi:hypothetical protein